ncbi:ABC transporter permease [Salipiger sp. P9]|uniref:ABC transporter permease n=1 Tax=Salipiger pentaromativorans TaxID=2943193 RepID=UPI002157EC33|nr:ABC transporter permease [Salipiger pentaromativorans]
MIRFIISRILQSIGVMLAVGLIAFALFTYVGDPVNNMLGPSASTDDRARLRTELGLDDPFLVQYARFIGRAVQGDFGLSYQYARPVIDIVAERLPATAELSLVAVFLALLVGIPMGIYAGIRPRSWLSKLFMSVSLIGVSLPTFFTGIVLIVLFAIVLRWLPPFGRGDVVMLGWWSTGLLSWSGLKSILLPSVTLSLFQMTLIMRLVRSEMLEIVRTDYIRFAQARGLTSRAIYFRHALKNTLVPVITITGLQMGSIIAFAVITETVFQWPGLGLLFIQALNFGDIPVMAAYLVFVSLMFVAINLFVDILYFVVDPRLRSGWT